MADKHPYMSGSGGVTQLVAQLRRSFPAAVTADTLKKLGIAPNNETYVLNIMRFVGVLDSENKKSAAAGAIFNKHDDTEFQEGFSKLVSSSYHELFDLHGEDAWTLPTDKLISFFRNNDDTSALVGTRQAAMFQALARISGKLDEGAASTQSPKVRTAVNSAPKAGKKTPVKTVSAATAVTRAATAPAADLKLSPGQHQQTTNAGMALTVRIEINLPAGGDQSTYDYIFKSIRENLLNGTNV